MSTSVVVYALASLIDSMTLEDAKPSRIVLGWRLYGEMARALNISVNDKRGYFKDCDILYQFDAHMDEYDLEIHN